MRFLKKIPIHPSFLLLFLWFVFTRNFQAFIIFITVVLTHEFGHYFVAKKLGYKLDSFFLAPYGVSLNYKEKTFESRDEILIALAGPFVNFVLSLIAVSLWWIFPESYCYTETFVLQSTMLALFNLIPAYPLDGGRIFIGAVNQLLPRKKAIKLLTISNISFSIIFLLLFIVSCLIDFNPTFALASCFMISGVLQTKFESKYEVMNMFKKKIKNFSRPLNLVVGEDVTLNALVKHIEANKFTIFYVVGEGRTRVLDEKILLSWTLKFPLTTRVGEILKK